MQSGMAAALPPTTGLDEVALGAPGPAFSPLYQQIKALLLTSLQAGEWLPGQVIPDRKSVV